MFRQCGHQHRSLREQSCYLKCRVTSNQNEMHRRIRKGFRRSSVQSLGAAQTASRINHQPESVAQVSLRSRFHELFPKLTLDCSLTYFVSNSKHSTDKLDASSQSWCRAQVQPNKSQSIRCQIQEWPSTRSTTFLSESADFCDI